MRAQDSVERFSDQQDTCFKSHGSNQKAIRFPRHGDVIIRFDDDGNSSGDQEGGVIG